MAIKTIDVPFFTNPEHATGAGSVNQEQPKGTSFKQDKAANKETTGHQLGNKHAGKQSANSSY